MFKDLGHNRALVIWEFPCANQAFTLGKYRALSVMVDGKFNGGSVSIMGTNDPSEAATFAVLNDVQGNPLIFYGSKLEQILEDCVQITVEANEFEGKVSVLISLAR